MTLQVVKDKAKAEETRVKKEFGKGMKKGFFPEAKKKGEGKEDEARKPENAAIATGAATSEPLAVGMRVKLHGLKAKPELNGTVGTTRLASHPKAGPRLRASIASLLDDGACFSGVASCGSSVLVYMSNLIQRQKLLRLLACA